MKNLIKRIIKEEINNFGWVDDINPSHEDIINFITGNNITKWEFGEHWEGNLDLRGTPIEDLGNLESVGGDLDLEGTPIKDLGNLKSVGVDFYLEGTPILKHYSEREIRQKVQVQGLIYLY